MRTEELDFFLPPALIAQAPAAERSGSRLLHYKRDNRQIAHRWFSDLPTLLQPTDVLVFNDARVIPARFMLRKETGGAVEGLFLAQPAPRRWRVMLKNAGHARRMTLDNGVAAQIVEAVGEGEFEIELETNEPAVAMLERVGRMPLPPYIKREKGADARDDEDRRRYQTVYASAAGAVAAPTAGLHFTPELLHQMEARGIEKVFVTLHVGMGTFKPVTADTLAEHVMHSESYTISPLAAATLNQAKATGRRIVAVGTTSARVLESQPEVFESRTGETSIFIYPHYRWKHVAGMITNFHLPRTTLIAMIAALIGLDEQRRVYREAIEQKYRFFSYGDAMFIE
jgi:S-adenosylmethionine:tRNA ribosyltransferase-isomerase